MGLNDIMQIGTNIKRIRKEKGYTQKAFAELVKIPYTTYSNYENNNRVPSTERLEKIAAGLDVSVYDLIDVDYQYSEGMSEGMSSIMMRVGENIWRIRKEKGYTQAELARRLNISQQSVEQFEKGKNPPKLETIEKIAAALGVSSYDLIYGGSNEENHDDVFHEDKREIVVLLYTAIKRTRAGENLVDLIYLNDEENDLETVTAVFKGGAEKKANVSGDSGIAMIRDIMKQIDF